MTEQNGHRSGERQETEQQKQELAAYEKLRALVKKIFAEAHETVNAETLHQAVDKAVKQLKEMGEYSAETVNRGVQALKKDLASAVQRLEPKWEVFAEKTADLFDAWRDRGTVFLGRAATAIGEWLRQAGERLEHPLYRSGEMTAGGSFQCTACGAQVTLPRPGHLPSCPQCQKTEFHRV